MFATLVVHFHVLVCQAEMPPRLLTMGVRHATLMTFDDNDHNHDYGDYDDDYYDDDGTD